MQAGGGCGDAEIFVARRRQLTQTSKKTFGRYVERKFLKIRGARHPIVMMHRKAILCVALLSLLVAR